MQRIPLAIGARFGHWTVTGESRTSGKLLHYPCRCACGTERAVRSDFLRYGRSRSCGCVKAPRAPRRLISFGGRRAPQTTTGLDIHAALNHWRA